LRKSAFHKIWQSIHVVPKRSTINAVMRLCSQEVCSWPINYCENCEIRTPLGDNPKSGYYDETVFTCLRRCSWSIKYNETCEIRTPLGWAKNVFNVLISQCNFHWEQELRTRWGVLIVTGCPLIFAVVPFTCFTILAPGNKVLFNYLRRLFHCHLYITIIVYRILIHPKELYLLVHTWFIGPCKRNNQVKIECCDKSKCDELCIVYTASGLIITVSLWTYSSASKLLHRPSKSSQIP
jgi:hypothetical protein